MTTMIKALLAARDRLAVADLDADDTATAFGIASTMAAGLKSSMLSKVMSTAMLPWPVSVLGTVKATRGFIDFMRENRDLAHAMIFEISVRAFRQRSDIASQNMGRLRELGFRFSLDKVTDIDFDFQDLSRADVKFVKIAAEVLLAQLLEVEGRMAIRSLRDLQASDFASMTRRYGIEIVAEKIEAERQVIDVLELDIAYGQGHLFGEPRAIREAVLAETAPPAEFMRTAMRRQALGR